MGWFNKKDKDEKKDKNPGQDIPELPKLPDLPELPRIKEKNKEPIHQLPSFPNSSLGQKFSQNTIKQAISGPKREHYTPYPEGRKGERVFEADDFATPIQRMQTMPKPLKPISQREFDFHHTKEEPEFEFDISDFRKEPKHAPSPEPHYEEPEFSPTPTRREPVFIRIDKFEESLKIFEKAKKELSEIERALKDIEKVREDEQNELESWKSNVLKIKEQIEIVDRDIFSRLE